MARGYQEWTVVVFGAGFVMASSCKTRRPEHDLSAVVRSVAAELADAQPDLGADAAVISPSSPAPRKSRLVRIPGGKLRLGRDDQGFRDAYKLVAGWRGPLVPVRLVTMPSFWLDETLVTVSQYEQCVKAGACKSPAIDQASNMTYAAQRLDHPVNCIRWKEADTYCRWRHKRLPTSDEWEYAARRPDGRWYPWGNDEREHPLKAVAEVFYKSEDDWSDSAFHGIDRHNREQVEHAIVTHPPFAASTLPVTRDPQFASVDGVLNLWGNVQEWVYDDGRPGDTFEIMPWCSQGLPTTDRPPALAPLKTVRGGYDQLAISSKYSTDGFWHDISFRCAFSGEHPPDSVDEPPAGAP